MTKKELKRELKLLEADFEVVSHSRKAWEELSYKIAKERDLAWEDMADAETAANEAESKLEDSEGQVLYWKQTALIIEEQYDRLLTQREEADAIIDADAERIEAMSDELGFLESKLEDERGAKESWKRTALYIEGQLKNYRKALEEIDFNAAYLESSLIPRAEFWKHTASVRREIARKALGR